MMPLAWRALRRFLVSSAIAAVLLRFTLPASAPVLVLAPALAAGAIVALLATIVLGARPARWTRDLPLVCILVVAAALRITLATTELYVHDEEHTAIPLSQTISFTPGAVHLPLRGENHPALPAYVVKASGEYFGHAPAGYRMLSVLFGLWTIVLIFSIGLDGPGPVAARWAAALLAFNDYFLGVSARATAHVPHLFLVTAAMYAFSRFLATDRPIFIYAAGAAIGLAFYAKEHAALLLPIFFFALLATGRRRWLRSPHPYLACAVFVACIAPDLFWNATARNSATTTYGNQTVHQASYADHLRRFGGVSLSPYPAMFYAKPLAQAAARQVTGAVPQDETPEYRSLNSLLGLAILAAVAISAVSRTPRTELQRFLLIQFGFVFLFFSLIRPGNPPGRLDPVSWIWVETTILPAVLLTGARLAEASGWRRLLSWPMVAAFLGLAVVRSVG